MLLDQKPFAAILGCSDSRVAPEILFDQGIGDIFVVRVAGNVAGPIEMDSLDYATYYLGASLILVLGHERCGAVQAVLNNQSKAIESVAALIEPAVKSIENKKEDSLTLAVKANVKSVVAYLKSTPVIAELVKQGKVEVVGGFYDLNTGKVEIINN